MTEAKRAFVLADRLTAGPFDSRERFLESLERFSAEVVTLSAAEIDSIVGRDHRRLCDYSRATWRLDVVDLRRCCVWPGMGGRAWARGSAFRVAEMFKQYEPRDSRVWNMKQFADIFSVKLPVIVLEVPPQIGIDDGSHRAVAMALAGLTKVSAWVGRLCAKQNGLSQ